MANPLHMSVIEEEIGAHMEEFVDFITDHERDKLMEKALTTLNFGENSQSEESLFIKLYMLWKIYYYQQMGFVYPDEIVPAFNPFKLENRFTSFLD